ncbi:MAG: type II secretion system minor pseudopilin GspK, partial [Burkholderiales bacterium]|nr:type II secretion system minor pseudopilin GspK [Burkholderiales bacterium]
MTMRSRRPLPASPARQRGIAIITAVAVAALVASIAAFMAFRENLWLRQVENQHDLAQAQMVAHASIDYTRLILQEAGRNSSVDSAIQEWTTPITSMPVEQGSAGGHISDVQGKFNINNLILNGAQVSQPDLDTFKRLLEEVGLSADLAPAVLDWIDTDSDTRDPGGAEDPYYLSLDRPRRAANRTMFDISELAQVKGFNEQSVKLLAPFVVALPQRKPVNINFAPPEVLAAMLPSLDIATAKNIALSVRTQPFANLDDFRKALSEKAAAEVQSDYMDVK